MAAADGYTPTSPIDREVVARLNATADWAASLWWPLEAGDVMSGSAPSRESRIGAKRRSAVRLRPRVIWAALVTLAIAAAVLVPQIAGNVSRSTSLPTRQNHKGTGLSSVASCTTTVRGVSLNSKGVVIQLPEDPGPIISRAKAISIAWGLEARAGRRVAPVGAVAKLSSWTEVSAVYKAKGDQEPSTLLPDSPTQFPWTPIWVVMLPPKVSPVQSFVAAPLWYMVAMDAATGSESLMMQVGRTWFSWLSDRDPTLKGCPGGSTARVPFGVLTRDEEAYAGAVSKPPGTAAILKLTTVPVLNRADPGLYGGCIRQNCSLDELVWPTFVVYRAAPGHTLACLPPSASYPPGYRPKQVKEYYTLSVVGNSEIGCGPVPTALSDIKDLAPPVR